MKKIPSKKIISLDESINRKAILKDNNQSVGYINNLIFSDLQTTKPTSNEVKLHSNIHIKDPQFLNLMKIKDTKGINFENLDLPLLKENIIKSTNYDLQEFIINKDQQLISLEQARPNSDFNLNDHLKKQIPLKAFHNTYSLQCENIEKEQEIMKRKENTEKLIEEIYSLENELSQINSRIEDKNQIYQFQFNQLQNKIIEKSQNKLNLVNAEKIYKKTEEQIKLIFYEAFFLSMHPTIYLICDDSQSINSNFIFKTFYLIIKHKNENQSDNAGNQEYSYFFNRIFQSSSYYADNYIEYFISHFSYILNFIFKPTYQDIWILKNSMENHYSKTVNNKLNQKSNLLVNGINIFFLSLCDKQNQIKIILDLLNFSYYESKKVFLQCEIKLLNSQIQEINHFLFVESNNYDIKQSFEEFYNILNKQYDEFIIIFHVVFTKPISTKYSPNLSSTINFMIINPLRIEDFFQFCKNLNKIKDLKNIFQNPGLSSSPLYKFLSKSKYHTLFLFENSTKENDKSNQNIQNLVQILKHLNLFKEVKTNKPKSQSELILSINESKEEI